MLAFILENLNYLSDSLYEFFSAFPAPDAASKYSAENFERLMEYRRERYAEALAAADADEYKYYTEN